MPEEDLKNLAERFAEKNPTFVRVVMESHHVDHEVLITSQGKITQWRYKAHAKEDK